PSSLAARLGDLLDGLAHRAVANALGGDVRLGDHAYQPVVLDHRDPADLGVLHGLHDVLVAVVRTHRAQVAGAHAVGHPALAATLGHRADGDVAVRDHARQPHARVVVHDRHESG